MALGDRYFEYTKSVYNNFVVYPPVPVASKEYDPTINYFEDKSVETPSRGFLFAVGVMARAIVKPFALAGALLGDLVADIIRIPVDLGKGIANLFTKEPISPPAEVVAHAPSEQQHESKHDQAPPTFFDYVPPKDLHVDPKEAQELVGGILDQNWAADQEALRQAEANLEEAPKPGPRNK